MRITNGQTYEYNPSTSLLARSGFASSISGLALGNGLVTVKWRNYCQLFSKQNY
jgi:hypothetical protein